MSRIDALVQSREHHREACPAPVAVKHRKRSQILVHIVQDEEISRALRARCTCAEDCISQFTFDDVKAIRQKRYSSNANEETQDRQHTLQQHFVRGRKSKVVVVLQHKLVCLQAYCVLLAANQSTGPLPAL
jgi:hypothetical protein